MFWTNYDNNSILKVFQLNQQQLKVIQITLREGGLAIGGKEEIKVIVLLL